MFLIFSDIVIFLTFFRSMVFRSAFFRSGLFCSALCSVAAVLTAALTLTFLAGPTAAWAQANPNPNPNPNQIVRQGIWVDKTGAASIEQAAGQQFERFTGPGSRGFTKAPTWLKLDIAPGNTPLVVSVQPPYLDNVRLYAAGPTWTMQQAGDAYPHAQRPRQDLPASFNVEPHPTQPTTVYLRIQTLGTHIFDVTALPAKDFEASQTLHTGVMGFYGGVVLVLALLSLWYFVATRDLLWGAGAALQLSTLLYVPAVMGFASKYVFPTTPAWADLGTTHMGLIQHVVGIVFFWLYFRSVNAPGWVTFFTRLTIYMYPVLLLLMLLGYTTVATSINVTLLLVDSVGGMVGVWFVKIEDKFSRHAFRFTYFVLTSWVMYTFAPVFGLLPLTHMHVLPPWFINVSVGVLQFLLLARRESLRSQAAADAARRIGLAEQQLVLERKQQTAAAHFMSMLLHELKNPLASIRLAALSLGKSLVHRNDGAAEAAGEMAHSQQLRLDAIDKSVVGINSVLDRCRQADHLAQGSTVVNKQPEDVAALVKNLVQVHHGGVDALRARIELLSPPEVSANVDKFLIELVVNNLLDNALNYSAKGSSIQAELALQTRDGVAGFTFGVRNQVGAAGFPDNKKLFEKYYRAPKAHEITGSGLGLHLVKSFAALCGGDVTYTANVDTVQFTLWHPAQ